MLFSHFKYTLGATLVDAELNEIEGRIMAPEQRAVKWFEKVPEAAIFHLTRDLLFAKDRNFMALVLLFYFLLELILRISTDGSFVFNYDRYF